MGRPRPKHCGLGPEGRGWVRGTGRGRVCGKEGYCREETGGGGEGARSFCPSLVGQPNGGDPLKQQSSNPPSRFLLESSGAGVRTDV